MRRVLEVDRGDARLRLDRLLVARLPDAAGLSRTRIAAWIRDGRVEVDGVPATRAAQRLRPGQAIALDLPEPPPRQHLAEARPLTVIYEDDALLAIDKPAGLVMHPTRRHPSGTLMNALLAHLAHPPGGNGRVHLVHRLDRETSGIVLVAKSPAVHATLARAMARRGVIVRRLEALEDLGAMDVFCTDKTGTLTEGVIVLDAAVDAGGVESAEVLRLAYLNAAFETGIDNPLDAAIVAAGERARLDAAGYRKIDEIPYDFIRKRLTIVVAPEGEAREHVVITKGAFATVLAVCTVDPALRERLEAYYQEKSAQGFRMLAVATRRRTFPRP